MKKKKNIIQFGVTGLNNKIINVSDSISFMIFEFEFSLFFNYTLLTILEVFTYFNMANAPHLKNLSPLKN